MPNRREEIIVGVAEDQDGWRLRLATFDDIDGLHSLASIPLVYRYLFDGAAPDREFIAGILTHQQTPCKVGFLGKPFAYRRLTKIPAPAP